MTAIWTIYSYRYVCNKMNLMAYGGTGYAHLLIDMKPMLKRAGVTEDETNTMLVENPNHVLELV